MRVHLGAGAKYWPGWVNVDAHGEQDVMSDALALKLDADTASEIQAIHLFEHLPRLKVEAALADWRRVLKSGGQLVLEMPCLDKMAQLIVDGERDLRMTLLGIFGDPRDPKPDMMHQWSYTRREITDLLTGCGFVDVQTMEPKFHFPKRDMRVTARKP